MQKLFLVLGLLIACAVPLAAQAKPPTQTAEQAVLQITREWLAAEERHDRPTLQRIIADDFEGTAPMGHTVSKDDVMPTRGKFGWGGNNHFRDEGPRFWRHCCGEG